MANRFLHRDFKWILFGIMIFASILLSAHIHSELTCVSGIPAEDGEVLDVEISILVNEQYHVYHHIPRLNRTLFTALALAPFLCPFLFCTGCLLLLFRLSRYILPDSNPRTNVVQ